MAEMEEQNTDPVRLGLDQYEIFAPEEKQMEE